MAETDYIKQRNIQQYSPNVLSGQQIVTGSPETIRARARATPSKSYGQQLSGAGEYLGSLPGKTGDLLFQGADAVRNTIGGGSRGMRLPAQTRANTKADAQSALSQMFQSIGELGGYGAKESSDNVASSTAIGNNLTAPTVVPTEEQTSGAMQRHALRKSKGKPLATARTPATISNNIQQPQLVTPQDTITGPAQQSQLGMDLKGNRLYNPDQREVMGAGMANSDIVQFDFRGNPIIDGSGGIAGTGLGYNPTEADFGAYGEKIDGVDTVQWDMDDTMAKASPEQRQQLRMASEYQQLGMAPELPSDIEQEQQAAGLSQQKLSHDIAQSKRQKPIEYGMADGVTYPKSGAEGKAFMEKRQKQRQRLINVMSDPKQPKEDVSRAQIIFNNTFGRL
ncbi:MAG: hypothetical protein KAJ39_02050 [Gammaproteobacteria bacterium]|nr:hypothetical protein [Gammaproteobacteria bacterium]